MVTVTIENLYSLLFFFLKCLFYFNLMLFLGSCTRTGKVSSGSRGSFSGLVDQADPLADICSFIQVSQNINKKCSFCCIARVHCGIVKLFPLKEANFVVIFHVNKVGWIRLFFCTILGQPFFPRTRETNKTIVFVVETLSCLYFNTLWFCIRNIWFLYRFYSHNYTM